MIKEIKCPDCQTKIDVNEWFSKFAKSNGIVYFKCAGCKEKIGSTLTMVGTVSIWNKKDEM